MYETCTSGALAGLAVGFAPVAVGDGFAVAVGTVGAAAPGAVPYVHVTRPVRPDCGTGAAFK